MLLELRIYFQDDVVLIQLSKNGGDQTLPESVVQRVVDVGRKNAEAGSSIAIDGEHREQTLMLLVAGDIAQFGQGLELVHEARHPISQLLCVRVFQAVLKLRGADAIFHGQVLHRLHEERDAVYLGKLRLEPPDYVGGGNLALLEGFEVDLNAAAVQGGIDAIDADEGRQTLDGRVLQNHVRQGALPARDGSKRNILRTLRNAEDHAGVLHGEKALGYVNVEKDGANKGRCGDQKRRSAKTQHKFQRAAIKRDDGIKRMLRFPVEPALVFFFLVAEQLGGHHRGDREQNARGHTDGDGEGHGKFAEQPANDITHEQQGNEHGDQGDGQRQNGETDLLGAFEPARQSGMAVFDIAGNICYSDASVCLHD